MTSKQKPKVGRATSSNLVQRCLIAFAVCLVIIAVAVVAWSTKETLGVVSSQTAVFASVMRVIRPIIFLTILTLWCPVFRWLETRSWVEAATANRAVAIWPRLAIWTALFEVTVGQGQLMIGLLAIGIYWFFVRSRVEP